MSTSNRNTVLAAVALIILAIWWGTSNRGVPSVETTGGNRKAASESTDSAALAKLETEMGMKSTLMRADESNYYFDVVIAQKRRCGPGDLDIIRIDAQHRHNDHLLLSLEPLVGEGSIETVKVPMQALDSSFHYQFTIPKRGKLQPYGLYLCADDGKTKGCHGKAVFDPNHFISVYSADPQAPAEPASVFYYQLVTFHDDRIAAFSGGRLSAATEKTLPLYLEAGGSQAAPEIIHNTNLIGSLAVEFGMATRIDLPTHDFSLCGGHQQATAIPAREGTQ